MAPAYEYHGLMVRYWDLLRGDTSNWPDRSFYLDVITRHGQPVLDVGCSSGRLLLDYLAIGIDIDGVDISPEMIARCAQNAAGKGFDPRLHVQNMTELSLPRTYRTILVPSSSIQLLLEPGSALAAMERFYDHLEPGGGVAAPFMTLWTPVHPLESESTQEAKRPEDGATVRRTTSARFHPDTNMEDTRDTWEIILDGRVIETETHEQAPATRSYTQAEALALFEQAGFEEIAVFSGFTSAPAAPTDTIFALTGTRPRAH